MLYIKILHCQCQKNSRRLELSSSKTPHTEGGDKVQAVSTPRFPAGLPFLVPEILEFVACGASGKVFQQFSRDFPGVFLGNPQTDPGNSPTSFCRFAGATCTSLSKSLHAREYFIQISEGIAVTAYCRVQLDYTHSYQNKLEWISLEYTYTYTPNSAVKQRGRERRGPQKSSRNFVSESGRLRVQISLWLLWTEQSTILAFLGGGPPLGAISSGPCFFQPLCFTADKLFWH